ncbi:small multi-drug export protein [bacterium]|nr:small multi-drug export protein [bacterium]
MIISIVWLALITLIPTLELRASIPIGIFKMADQLSWPVVVLICIIVNILLGWLIFWVLGPAFSLIRKWHWFDQKVWPVLERTQYKIHPYVEKYGELGVAVFIGIPLPGSGVYTGALGAYLLGVDRKKFTIANVLGVLIAGAAVTLICLLILHGAVCENSWMARLFVKIRH